ncbi:MULTISPECIES: HNH endonuclease [unclassified Bradyrhizobium]|uniref:HNH endonuclease n=1 Tax=Bradyrhizobium sp. USDA 4541 TaxID=2817704 RepID=UPI0020A3CF2C|nr:hypothetical protein [Bradyrhizobium sp. USDA 4541]MCP1848400.1 hypothetical protein [Bradyrhizobium sp. USDA 4541]
MWETFDKKCFHCSRELPFVDMRVDHIVPERLHHGEEEGRKAVLTKIGLPETFNILGNENLAPSCESCNGRKSGSILIEGATAVALTRIARKLPILEANRQKKREDRSLEFILRAVARSLDKGAFSSEELLNQIQKVVANAERDHDPSVARLEPGRIWAHAKPLGFTQQARQRMEARRFAANDVAQVVLEGFIGGSATARKIPSQIGQYLIEGPDDLDVEFAIEGATVVVLSVFRDDD